MIKNSEKSYDLSPHVTKGLSSHTPHLSASFTMRAISSADKVLRLCPNIDWSWTSEVGADGDDRVDRVRMNFGFSFDAVPTIDTVLYFRG